MEIFLCNKCGLVQSIPTKKKGRKRIVTTSSNADWGNIRHGKGLRLKKSQALLSAIITSDKIKKILDIGSNRGDFIKWVSSLYPFKVLTAIEPDKTIVRDYKTLLGLQLYLDKYENVKLNRGNFDFIYCSHTLEHVDSASHLLKKINNVLKIGGYLFLETPNIDILNKKDIVEQFFVDKHRFHFNREPLLSVLEGMGFKIIQGRKDTDMYNITILAQKYKDTGECFPVKYGDKNVVNYNKMMIAKYKKTLIENRKKLLDVGEHLNRLTQRQKTAIWGGGRIFDALVKYGRLKTNKFDFIIDNYLCNILPDVHNLPIKKSNYLRIVEPDVVIILASSSTDEIEKEVRQFGIRHVIKFSDLMT